MPLYSRYTSFRYDPAVDEQLTTAWDSAVGTAITRQPGFVGAQQLVSLETPGVRRSVTTWREKEDFERFYHGPDHAVLNQVFADLGVAITERDGAEVLWRRTPDVAEVRIVRTRINDLSRLPELERLWHEHLAPFFRSQRGLREVEAAVSEAESSFVIILHWESKEVADRFVASAEHEEQVSVPLRAFTTKVGRDDLRPLG